MIGLAQKLFAERALKTVSVEAEKQSKWPLLEKMLGAGCLGYVDLALANQLIGSKEDESFAAFVCHLSMASRRGHVCIKVDSGRIKPSPEEIWTTEEYDQAEEITSSDWEQLVRLIERGAKNEKLPLVGDATGVPDPQVLPDDGIQAPIIKNHGSYYLQRYWRLESSFLTHIRKLFSGNHPIFPLDDRMVHDKVKTLLKEQKLLDEQAEAVLAASQSPLTIITGGPGTGKTYTAGVLLRIILETAVRDNKVIALAAPTGKAAANLESSIKKALKGMEGSTVVKAQTLHQLLGIKKSRMSRTPSMLTADLILVDESSMIDVSLMGQLFAALKPGARLILLGDRFQLPSVEAGSLFADLTDYFQSEPNKYAKVVELKTCLRAELKSIIDLADRIKTGSDAAALQLLDAHVEGIHLICLDKELRTNDQQKRLLKEVVPYFPEIKKLPGDPLDLLEQFARFRILTPMRKGPLGVEALNGLIFQALNSKMLQNGWSAAPIMVMKNDYRRDLYNGETGILVKDRESEFVFFPSRDSDKKFRKISLLLMPRFEYAYCLSVHKSQGSEFDHVVLLLPDGTHHFGREALYTGATRARRRLDIWSSPPVLSQMMKLTAVRQSGVGQRLCGG